MAFAQHTAILQVLQGLIDREIRENARIERNAAILLASHNMGEVERLCDDVVLLQAGRVFDRGSPRELIERFGREDMEEVFLDMARGRRQGAAS